MCERADEIKSERDRRFKRGSSRWREATHRAAILTAKAARIRREALHVWSTSVCRQARDLTVIAPPIKEMTATPRGTERDPGAHVEPVSNLNRSILNQAPAAAIAMLKYKSAEAGIPFCEVTDQSPSIAIGEKLVTAGRVVRKAKRAIRRI